MRRVTVIPLMAILLGAILIAGGRFAAAQDPGLAGHPATGSWNVETEPGDAEYSPRLVILSGDGSALFVSGYRTTGIGSWEASSDTTAIVTFTVVTNGPAQIVIRASIGMAPDGASFTGTFTNEIMFDPAGEGTSGEIGPGTIAGTRLTAEAPGTPTMSFDDFFRSPESTPEATPEP